ncbi:metalloregulator ArsR/SmtB family transcription factor [uncultured Arsenicicoccus sp.]|uniref:helix-turn-helix transcriptional regulator n=1 Tax=uncultured Arsenicicoccus sp. TaxID=491339 RepID=UPI002594AC50|nr:helix-turn-helix domain-containing protein [uncultured Arsenicicoccus sp.]
MTSVAQELRWGPEADGRPSLLAPSMRRRVIDVLAAAPLTVHGRPGLAAQDVATRLDIHVTTARFHLDVLLAAHVVEARSERLGVVGRPRKIYHLVPAGVRLHPTHRELSALVTSCWGLPEPTGSATMFPAARAWAREHADLEPLAWAPAATPGEWLVTVERLVQTMAEWGFRHSISLVEGGRTVDLELRAAPFLAIAARHAPVLHAFRRGLITGVLDRLGEPEVDVVLTPHEDIAITTAHLTSRTPFRHTVGTGLPGPVLPPSTTTRRRANRRRDA